MIKLFIGCTELSYPIKYGESIVHFQPSSHEVRLALLWIAVPSSLNAHRWRLRAMRVSKDGSG